MALHTLDDRLANWRAWLRHLPRYRHCGSAENFYRSPQHWHPHGARPRESKAADAWDVCLAAATLPYRLHFLLRLKYVIEFNDGIIASILREDGIMLRCKAIDVPVIDWEARGELSEALGQPLVVLRNRAVTKARLLIGLAPAMT